MGLSLKRIKENIRDIFDANTASDQAKRMAAGQPQFYQQQQAQRQATAFNQPTQQVSFNGPQNNTQFNAPQNTPKPTTFSQPSKPAVSFTQPTAQVNIPSYGSNPFKQIVNRTRDYFDANTPQDMAKRTAAVAPQIQQIQNSPNISQERKQTLVNDLTSYKPKFNPVVETAKSYGKATADITKGITGAAVNTVQLPVSAARLGVANYTNNTQAANKARIALGNDAKNNFLWNEGFNKTADILSGAIVANKQADASRKANENYANTIANAYGNTPQARAWADSNIAANTQADQAAQLGRYNLTPTTSLVDTSKRVGLPIVSTGAQIALNAVGGGAGAKTGAEAAKQLSKQATGQVIRQAVNKTGKQALGFGAANGGIGAADTLANGGSATDALKAGATGFAVGAAMPIGGAVLGMGAKPTARAIRNGVSNIPIKPALNKIANFDRKLSQYGGSNYDPTKPTITNMFGQEVPNPAYVAAQRKASVDPLGGAPIEKTPDLSKLSDDELNAGFYEAKNNTSKILDDPKYRGKDGLLTKEGQRLAKLQLEKATPFLDEQKARVTKQHTPVAPIEKTPTSKLKNDELYSAANADVSFGVSGGGKVVIYKPDGTDGVAKDISYDKLSTKTRKELIDAENELEVAKSNSTGPSAPNVITPVIRAKNRLRQAQSNAIEELGLQDYATIETLSAKADGTTTIVQKTKNDRFNDWLEQKYNEETNPIAQLTLARDMTANPQKYKAQFEAESSIPVTAPIEKTPTPKVEAPKSAPIEKTQLTPREEINQINRKAAQRGDKYTMSEEKRLAELQDQINTAPPVEKKSIDMTVEDWMQKGYTREQAERTVAEKQMTKKLNDEYAGKKYNEGRNSEIVSDEDLRTDKSKAGQRIIQSVQGYKEYTDPNGNKQLRLKVNTATVDHTPESLNKRITELEKQKTFYDGELAPDLEKELQDLYSQKNKSTPVSAPIEKTPTLKVKPTPKAKVSLKQEVPTSPQKNVVSSTNNSTKPNVVKSGKPVVAAKNGIVQGVKRALLDQDQVILDELRNIEKTTGQKGLVDKFMYNSNMQRGSNQIANVNIGKSQNLQSAFGGMSKKTYVRFNEYANARTELAMAGDKTKLSAPKEALAKSVANGHDEFSANFDALNAHYKELATFLHDNGVITDKRFKEFVSNNDYIRIQRDMEDLNPSSFGKGNGYSLNSTITSQKRKGSERAILPAGETAAHYTQQVYKEVYRNKTGTQLVDTLSQHGLAKKLKDAAAARNRNVVTIRRNGKPEYYEVSPEMKQAMDNINPYHMNAVMQILSAPGRVLRAGVTGLNPVFIARNLVKDQAGSAINSEHLLSTHNPRSFFSGLFNAGKDSVGLNNDPLYADFLKHYGDTTSYDITRNAKDANKIVNQIRGGTKVKVGQALKNPIRAAENLAAITEKSTRFQNYRGEYLKAIGSGLSPADASERAAIAAWQNSVDFSRAGTWGRAINTVIPYWNPATQGVRQMGRTVTKHPIKSVLTATAVVGVPIVASTAWNLSSPENKTIYDNIPESEKDNNIILIPPDTTQNQDGTYDVIKIPLPPGYKDAFMPLRRMLEAYAKDKPLEANKIAQDILQTVSGPIQTQTMAQFAGSFIPQAVKPLVQQYANKDMFSGKPIVPDYIDNATDADGNPIPNNKKTYTDKVDGKTVATGSGTAQIIGDRLGVSPIRVEKFIKDTAGTVGLNALRSADWQLSKIGVVPKERIGGQSVIQGLKKSFGQSQGIENANASDGSKYYKNQQKATSNLTGNEKAAFDTLHPSKTNFLGEDIFDEKKRISSYTKASAYLQYPKVWEADKKLNDLQKQAGNPSNPLYDLPEDQARRVLLKATLPPGAKDPELSNLYQKEWYQDYKIKTDKYYQGIAASLAKDGKTIPKTDNPYPTASPELQKAMDAYSALPKGTGARSDWIRANQATFNAMTQQWAANDAWQNKERVAMGLSPIDNTADASNSYGGYSKYGYSRSGGGGGGGSSDSTGGIGNPYKYAVATSDGPAKTTVKIPGGSATKVGVARKVIAKPKVSLKKSIA